MLSINVEKISDNDSVLDKGQTELSQCEKLFADVLLQRIRKRTEETTSASEAGLRAGRLAP